MTQRDRIRVMFQEKPNEWIPLNNILDMRISQYGRCIHELRKQGLRIENIPLGTVNGQKHTAFMYVPWEKQGEFKEMLCQEYQKSL